MRCPNLPAGYCVAGGRLLKQCPRIPAGHCDAWV